MKKTLLFLFSALCISVQAQDYFQQEVNYTINLRLDDQKHEISAFEEIESYGENIRFMVNLNIGNAINKLRSSF